jgi:hypothetical protein
MSSDKAAARSANEGVVAAQMPALSLDALQWQHLRIDQSLIVHITASCAKVAQLEALVAESSALHQDALSKCEAIKEECRRLRQHGASDFIHHLCFASFHSFQLRTSRKKILGCSVTYLKLMIRASKQRAPCMHSMQQS